MELSRIAEAPSAAFEAFAAPPVFVIVDKALPLNALHGLSGLEATLFLLPELLEDKVSLGMRFLSPKAMTKRKRNYDQSYDK